MKKILTLIVLSTFLVSCGGGKQAGTTNEKKAEFFVKTVTVGSLTKDYELVKSSKIEASDEVKISSETMGRVSSIMVKEGDKVKKGQDLVYISDTSININNSYQQALLNLEQAKISYESNKISLDKAVYDTETQVKTLENNLATTKQTIEQNLRQAKDNLENANVNLDDSKSSLDLQKLKNSIEKMELDYNNQELANREQINSYILNLQKEKDNLANLMRDVVEFNDDLFRISPEKSDAPYEVFLGADAPVEREATELATKYLMSYEQTNFSQLTIPDEKNIDAFISEMDIANKKVKSLLDDTKYVLNNSITSLGRFSEADKQSLLRAISGYISQYQGINASYVATKNAATTFVNTYENNLKSLREQINLAKKDVEITKKSLQSGEVSAEVNYDKLVISSKDAVTQLELQLANAKNTHENAKQTRNVTLRNLSNVIKNAELAVSKAGNEVAKLVVSAPISGIVAEIKVNEGQTYPNGTPFLTILSDSKRELDIFLDGEDLEKISMGDTVTIVYRGNEYKGKVFSKSTLADENLNYRVKVELTKDIQLVGGIADVRFTLQAKNNLIPINVVSIIDTLENGNKKAQLQVYTKTGIEKKVVELGSVYGTKIELLTDMEKNTEIVTNDTSNYNPEKQTIKQVTTTETEESKTEKNQEKTPKQQQDIIGL